MSTNSEVGKLILANIHLSKLVNPFRSYYAYYMLAEKLQLKLEEFFNSNNNEFLEEISSQLPNDASGYICHKSEYVKNDSTIKLKSLMLGFLGIKLSRSKIEEIQRPEFGGLDWKILDIQKKKLDEKWATNDRADRDRRVGDFWRRARNCNLGLGQSSQYDHTSLDLMDLISACSGYRNFADFLEIEFGEDYDLKKDDTLQALGTSAAKPTGLDSSNHETEQSLLRTFASNLKRKILIFSSAKRKKKKSLKQGKARSEEPAILQFWTKENAGRLIGLMPIFLLISLGCLSIYMFTLRTEDTQVNVTLTTRYLHLQIAQATHLRSPDRVLLGSRNHFSIRNAVYTLDYPFSDTLPAPMRIKSVLHELVGIEHIKLPNDSKVTIETPTEKDLYIEFSESEGLNGFIPIDHSIVFSPEETDSVIYGQNPTGTGINFQSYKDQRNEISLIDADDFEWPPFYVKSISFGELKQDQVEYGIESAQIDFLKSEKSIRLNPKDLLSIIFEDPIKLLIKYNEGLVSLQFTGVVNSVYAGPDIFGRSNSNNQMPKLWEERKEILGMVAIIVVLVLPAIMMFKPRTRQSI